MPSCKGVWAIPEETTEQVYRTCTAFAESTAKRFKLDPDDLASESYDKANRSWSLYDQTRPLNTWLHPLVMNVAKDMAKREGRRDKWETQAAEQDIVLPASESIEEWIAELIAPLKFRYRHQTRRRAQGGGLAIIQPWQIALLGLLRAKLDVTMRGLSRKLHDNPKWCELMSIRPVSCARICQLLLSMDVKSGKKKSRQRLVA